MSLETFTGRNMRALLARVHAELGEDAIVLDVRQRPRWDGSMDFEVLASDGTVEDPSWQRAGLGTSVELTSAAPAMLRKGERGSAARRPQIIALIGPTGSGKTTTLAKLAGHPRVFGLRNTAFISLDTYRVGAVEQLKTYADIARVPVEVVRRDKDVPRILKRLYRSDLILIDTPGLTRRASEQNVQVQRWFSMIRPDEVHLVLPAGMQRAVVATHLDAYGPLHFTHLLPTKLDECPEGWELFDLAAELKRPMRWFTDGQEVPADVRPARPRLLAASAGKKKQVPGRQD